MHPTGQQVSSSIFNFVPSMLILSVACDYIGLSVLLRLHNWAKCNHFLVHSLVSFIKGFSFTNLRIRVL